MERLNVTFDKSDGAVVMQALRDTPEFRLPLRERNRTYIRINAHPNARYYCAEPALQLPTAFSPDSATHHNIAAGSGGDARQRQVVDLKVGALTTPVAR